jgi:hypothetical protein
MPTQAPSGAALESGQRGLFAAEPQLVNLRSQVAVVRTLADQVEQLSRAADFDGPGAQMVEEMARLGCRLIDAAAALADASQIEEASRPARWRHGRGAARSRMMTLIAGSR